jgi:hypothetical protein
MRRLPGSKLDYFENAASATAGFPYGSASNLTVAKNADLEHIVAMKYIVILVAAIAAAPVFGQDPTAAPAKPPITEAKSWSKLGQPIEGTKGFTLYGRDIRLNREGEYQLLVKITPVSTTAFARAYSLPTATNFVLQYATVDCNKKLLLLEKTGAYDTNGKVLEARGETLTPSSRKDTVKPGSVGEALYRFVCVETTSLPLTENRN